MVKLLLQAFVMCQSMFCRIPVPGRIWEDRARPWMLVFLPVVGLEIGLLWAGFGWVLRYFSLPDLAWGVLMTLFFYLLTGFIHLDGYLDVTDALGSYKSQQERRAILKDSHVGSFAVIGCFILFLPMVAFLTIGKGNLGLLVLLPVVSRCGSGLAITLLRPMAESEYAGTFREGVSRLQPMIFLGMLLVALLLGFLLFGRLGFALLAEVALYLLALWRSFRALGGMNGDISGYCITLSELAGVCLFALL